MLTVETCFNCFETRSSDVKKIKRQRKILLVDKEIDWTSFDVVAKIRSSFKTTFEA